MKKARHVPPTDPALTKADARLIHALKSRRGREKHGLFVVEGIRVVEDLVASTIDLEFVLIAPTLGDNPRGQALHEALRGATAVRVLDDRALAQVTDTDAPQGVLAVARIPNSSLDSLQLQPDSIVLVLDAVQDPGNLGTLIRSADAFGAAAVIALPGTTDYWNPKVIRSAAGAAFRKPLLDVSDDEAWRWLAQHDVVICGADMNGVPIDSLRLDGAAALVVGNEGAGLREETRARLTQLVAIPMRGETESLNVAVAASILLYEFSRRK
jgi:TrmH family RNA methyltransferase